MKQKTTKTLKRLQFSPGGVLNNLAKSKLVFNCFSFSHLSLETRKRCFPDVKENCQDLIRITLRAVLTSGEKGSTKHFTKSRSILQNNFHCLHSSFIFSPFSNVSLCLSCHWLQQRTSDNQDKVKHSKRMKIQCQCLGCHLLPVCHIIIHFSSEHDPDKLQGRPNQAAEICCRVTGINTSVC